MILGRFNVILEGDRLTLKNDSTTFSFPIPAYLKKGIEEIKLAALDDVPRPRDGKETKETPANDSGSLEDTSVER